MGLGLTAFGVFLVAIVVWSTLFRRGLGEGMGVGWVILLLFTGPEIGARCLEGLWFALTHEVIFAAMMYVVLSDVMERTGVIDRLVQILNTALHRVPGGAGYAATVASALFGLVSGSASGNAALVGSVSIPWMLKTHWSKVRATTIIAGNAGLGIALPPNASMFILLGAATVSGVVSADALYVTLLQCGLWALTLRLALIAYFVRKDRITLPRTGVPQSLRSQLRANASALIIFLGIIIPAAVTFGPLPEFLDARPDFGGDARQSISLIVWIPVLMTWLAVAEGWRSLPKRKADWYELVESLFKKSALIGPILVFAFASAKTLVALGLSEDVGVLLSGLHVSPILLVGALGILLTLASGPLSSTALMATIGPVAFSLLYAAGVPPSLAAAVILIFASNEGAVPPNAPPVYIASAMSGVEPEKTFVPLIGYYVIPNLIQAILLALGFLPVLYG